MSPDPRCIGHRRDSDGAVQTVSEHLTGVAGLASSFADKLGLSLPGELLGLLHDMGKYSDEFQGYVTQEVGQDDLRGKIDHSTAGAQLLWDRVSRRGSPGATVGQALSLCLASHHGGLIDCVTPDGQDRFATRMRKEDAKIHLQEVVAKARAANPEAMDRVEQILSLPLMVDGLMQRLKAVYDSDKGLGKAGLETRFRCKSGLLLRMLFSCLIDADRTDTADFEKPWNARQRVRGAYVPWGVLVDRLEEHIGAFESSRPIDQIRCRVSDECLRASQRAKALFTLTVPTGGGKTLASLRFALNHAKTWGHDRVIYVVPYTTIIDQNAQVVRGILERDEEEGNRDSVVLEHHSNLTPEKETWKSRILSENWDAPVIYTTMAQLLEGLFGGGTRNVRRMHQLANAVIVFDEIQTIPLRAVHLFCNAMNLLVGHCGSTVVLCTATQPLLDRVDQSKGALRPSVGGEIISDVESLFRDLKRVELVDRRKPDGWTEQDIVDLAQQQVQSDGSCLVIVNTKAAALSLYRASKAPGSKTSIYHLSTSMCPAHRRDILAKIEKRIGKGGKPPEDPGPLLCISTQLIEAGVDIDFNTVIRCAAGLDSIAQAAGRCNRHGRPTRGMVSIVNPVDESLATLDDIKAGRNAALRVLGEYADAPGDLGGDLLSPQAMARYFSYYFFDRKDLMDYPISHERTDTILNMLSENTCAVQEYKRTHGEPPQSYWRQAFMSAGEAFKAIDAPTQGIVVPYGDEGKRMIAELCAARAEQLPSLLHRAQRLAVNAFPWVLAKIQERGGVHEVQEGTGILYVDERFYSGEYGLSAEPGSDMDFLHV